MDAAKQKDVIQQIVDACHRKRERSEDYIVRVDYAPNPLNYDGMDQVSAFVIRKDRVSRDFMAPKAETIFLEVRDADTVEEALTQLAQAAGVSL